MKYLWRERIMQSKRIQAHEGEIHFMVFVGARIRGLFGGEMGAQKEEQSRARCHVKFLFEFLEDDYMKT